MRRAWQIFVAPGDDSIPLPISPSPWHDERWVRIPREHWRLLLELSEKIDEEKSRLLESITWASDFNDNDTIIVKTEDVIGIVRFINQIIDIISKSDPLVPYATEEIPDEYENEEHIRMLEAVSAVLSESLRLKQPFRAWSE